MDNINMYVFMFYQNKKNSSVLNECIIFGFASDYDA